MSLVLITGGAGFIGSHLAARLLALGHEVHLADNFQRGARDQFLAKIVASDRARMVDLDLRAPDTADALSDQYDQIYHLAAIVGVANVARAPYSVLADNVAMLDSAIGIAGRQKNLSRFAFTSTSEVYAGTLAHNELTFPTPESSKLVVPDLGSPRTSYMLSKIYGESMCRLSGLPTTIFRPHNIYGPRMGMAHVIPELLQRAYRLNQGEDLEVYSVDHRRTFCYIDDAVEMIHLATADEAGAGATLNIGVEADEVSIGDLAGKILNAVGKPGSVVGLPATAGSPSRRVPDTSAVRALTGYTPKVTLDEGISRTFDWYRQNVFDAG